MAARRSGSVEQRHTSTCPAKVRRGEGPAPCRCAGSWSYRYREYPGGPRVGRGGYPTKAAAEAALREAQGDAERGHGPQSQEPFDAYAAAWLEAQRPRLKASTVDHYRRVIDVHLVPWFGPAPLERIRPQHVEGLVSSMHASGDWSAKTIANVLVVAKGLFSTAVRRGDLRASPAGPVAPPRQERRPVEMPSTDEVERALAACEDRYRLGFALGAYAGLRRGEVLALRFEDVDFEAGALEVRRSYNRHGLSDPKSRAGYRSVPLDEAVLRALHDAYAVAEEHGEAGYVLAGPGGEHLEPEVLDRAWRRAQKRAGVTHRPIHALRHHAISRWIAAGFSIKEAQEAAGHASAAMTLDRYGHVMPGSLAHQRERLAALANRRHVGHAEAGGPTNRPHVGHTEAPGSGASTGSI